MLFKSVHHKLSCLVSRGFDQFWIGRTKRGHLLVHQVLFRSLYTNPWVFLCLWTLGSWNCWNIVEPSKLVAVGDEWTILRLGSGSKFKIVSLISMDVCLVDYMYMYGWSRLTCDQTISVQALYRQPSFTHDGLACTLSIEGFSLWFNRNAKLPIILVLVVGSPHHNENVSHCLCKDQKLIHHRV